jgi:hypothetical protein
MPANLMTLAHFSVFFGEELAEIGGRHGHWHTAEVGESRLNVGGPILDAILIFAVR